MSDKNNQDKPSFFDPDDEAKSWPPSDSYEADDEDSKSESSNQTHAEPNLFKPEPRPESEPIIEPDGSKEVAGFDYVDSLINETDQESITKDAIPAPSSIDDFLIPVSKDAEAEAEEQAIEIEKIEESEFIND